MAIKCPKCRTDNPDTVKFCGECGTLLGSVWGPDPTDAGQDPGSSRPPGDIPDLTETMETPKEELTTGSTFAGRYQIIEELGKGGMGRVYKALDRKINEKIALKLIKPEIAKDKKTIERFSNELRLARKIRHKNVCGMFDLGEEHGIHYITMEFVDGEDLRRSIRRFGQLPLGKSISVTTQICEGLAEAHRLGVVHRDLKSSNIMIDKEGSVRIMDFGIARSLETEGITGSGVIIGTPEYMSPEQVEGKEVDRRSDIYSLGIILYEMVTGRVPFKGETALSIAMKQKTEKPEDPRLLNPLLPDDLSQIIMKCLEKDRQNRYKNTDELRSEIIKIEKFQKVGQEQDRIKPSIAVLPFRDMSPLKDQDYFCEGMAEELINALTKIEGLHVAARTSAFQFKGKDLNVRKIGEELGVKAVLEGSVRKAGDRLRITAQLINISDGYHLWSEKYDRDMEDIFAIQDEISLAIVENLKLKLLKKEKAQLMKRYTEDQEAYTLYLKGRYFWNRRYEGGLLKGIEYFQKAIEKDTSFASVYTGIADCYCVMGLYDWIPPKEAYPKAKAATLRALEIDDTLPEAHASLGWIKMFYDWDWAAAEKAFQRAIELNPNYATAHEWYAMFLAPMERFDEAISELKKAQELDPLSLIIQAMGGYVYSFAGLSDKAIQSCHKTIEMDPNFMLTYFFLGNAYTWNSRWKEAISAFQKLAALSGESPLSLGFLGFAYGMGGQEAEAQKILDQLSERSKDKDAFPFFKSLVNIGLGDKDRALEWLERAYDEKESMLAAIKIWPPFDTLRQESRFKALLKKLKLE
jgi:serine/threonine protein kinase/Flp pilus assembly protein TadD